MRTYTAAALIACLAAPGFAQEDACRDAWQAGYAAGIDEANAQLAEWHSAVVAQVQAQVDAQLQALHEQNSSALQSSLADAQSGGLPFEYTPPPAAPVSAPAQAAIPQGSTITIHDPQNLPPELFDALMDYVSG
ncbi:MAG: hypothetical protein Q4G36_07330 [Paracoccus sp. (in: a-proteobacteria)]|nr:hypothetical protein [Paracoccus sp. (in: a-proteobacteria)]